MTAQQLAGALAGSHGRGQALAGLGLSLPVAGGIGPCRVAEAQPGQYPQAVSIEGKNGPGPREQVNAVRSRSPDARVSAPRRPGDGKLRAPAQALDPFRRAGAGDAPALVTGGTGPGQGMGMPQDGSCGQLPGAGARAAAMPKRPRRASRSSSA
jgi:hypothetical protein